MRNLVNLWKEKIIFPKIYDQRNVDIGKIMKEEYLNVQTVKQYILWRVQQTVKTIHIMARPANC